MTSKTEERIIELEVELFKIRRDVHNTKMASIRNRLGERMVEIRKEISRLAKELTENDKK